MTFPWLAELVISTKERPGRCSLTPFRQDPRFRVTYFDPNVPCNVEGGILLHPDGRPLAPRDADLGIVLVDGSWKYSARMVRGLSGILVWRSIPTGLVTAYPRRSKKGTDPPTGLASIEALYAALWVAGKAPADLLSHYHWREQFLAQNAEWFARYAPV